ncbi:MAG TPA: xanthine dehydrogenase family protein subunit M [Blastocatellia bacterium]|nr:xanthine dehydrogenase family protein subunit M [Blastocatellia bacterium]
MRAYLPDYQLRTASSLDEAVKLLAGEPGRWRPIAGGTDLMVLLEAGKLPHRHLLSLWGLPELRGITATDGHLTLGALTTYTEMQADPVLRDEFPMLCEAASWTGSVAIQNRGTLGGNIANASPAADSLPALLVYEAELEIVSARDSQWVAYRDFHTGYKTMLLREDQLIKSIRLPRATRGWNQRTRKVGTRKAQAISKVCLAAMIRRSPGQHDQIEDIRLAYGSVAPVPIRAAGTEAFLRGRPVDALTIEAAGRELAAELSPIDDLRSTAEYRLRVAVNLLGDFLRQA